MNDGDVLRAIARSTEGLTTAELAQRLGVDGPTMSTACNRLAITDRIVSNVRRDGQRAWLPAMRSPL